MHTYTPHLTRFKLWSPVAISVELRLYAEGVGGVAVARYNLEVAGDGWWRLNVYKDLKGCFYTYRVQTPEGWLDETPGVFATAVGVNGMRAAVVDLDATNPDGWEADKRPPVCSPVIYELHHRDFSISHSSGVAHKGRFLALTERGTHSPEGLPTGIDHLVELGVPFPSNEYGEFVGYKTDHDPASRATSAGPLTSKFMTEKLQARMS